MNNTPNLTYPTLDESEQRLINFYRSCDEAKLLVLQTILKHLIKSGDEPSENTPQLP